MNTLGRIFVSLLLILTSAVALAYQPGVEELEVIIGNLETRSEKLNLADSVQMAEYRTLQDSISTLKDEIIALNQETINSLRRQKSLEGESRSLVNTATFFLLLVSLLMGTFFLAFRKRLKLSGSGGVIRVLAGDIKKEHGVEAESDPDKRRVHVLVVVSVAMMFGSLIMYLLRVM